MGVTPHVSVDAFFRELVVEAMAHRGISSPESTEHYLVGLLGAFTKARITERPFALMLAEASTEPGERVKTLKVVGDTSLYLTGFFSESIGRGIVQADYYMDLGGAAYNELANRLRSSSVSEIYDDLARNFPAFVDVLATVREQIDFCGADVVRFYEQWLKTRSDWVEGRLRALGVIVPGRNDDKEVH